MDCSLPGRSVHRISQARVLEWGAIASSSKAFSVQFSSFQFSRSVVSDSLRPHELQPGLPVHHQLPEFTQTHIHRNPSKMVGVARGHQRADTLKPYSHKTSQPNHTRTTALSNSMKLSHAHGATGSWWRGLTECGPLEKGMANHFSILALRTP